MKTILFLIFSFIVYSSTSFSYDFDACIRPNDDLSVAFEKLGKMSAELKDVKSYPFSYSPSLTLEKDIILDNNSWSHSEGTHVEVYSSETLKVPKSDCQIRFETSTKKRVTKKVKLKKGLTIKLSLGSMAYHYDAELKGEVVKALNFQDKDKKVWIQLFTKGKCSVQVAMPVFKSLGLSLKLVAPPKSKECIDTEFEEISSVPNRANHAVF